MDIASASSAFTAASGIAPGKLSLWVRSLILVFTLLWAAWEFLGFIHHVKEGNTQELHRGWFIFRVLLVLCFVWVMVFI